MTDAELRVEPLAVAASPADAVLALRGDAHVAALAGAWAGGGAVLASEPVRVAPPDADPFALLDQQPAVTGAERHPGAVGGGWIGLLGFALAHRVERLPPSPPARDALPPFALAFYDHVLRMDAAGRWTFEALWTPERDAALRARRDELERRLSATPAPAPFDAGPFAAAPPGEAGLREAVREAVERIHAGELFQANLTLRLEGPFAGDPLDAFAAALAVAPRHAALLSGPWGATIGLSPELFLRRRGREVVTRPIKGTVRREDAADAADAARAALVGSAKDRAENVMIVDLMRNDLGRVCAYGSVVADPDPVAEAHPGVWHLVSEVRGRLRDGVGDGELLRATFPPGSVTGAPKVQALRVIAELEGSARHAYTGAVGFASPVAGLELDVVIRTLEVCGGRAWLGAGGGIVADSDPDAEVGEALAKAAPIVAALGAELRAEPPGRRRLPAVRALAGGLERPDAAAGLSETIAVHAGRPVGLDAHLERLAASAAAVLGDEPPADLGARIDVALPPGDGVVRVVLGGDGRAVVDVGSAPAPAPGPVRVVPVLLPGGLGAHAWADRRLVDALRARHGATPLLVDADGAVLEAGDANVLVMEGDALVTPPADGRLLPGLARARALALANAREEIVDLDRLAAADAVLLVSSIAPLRVVGGFGRPLAPERVEAIRARIAGDYPPASVGGAAPRAS